MSEQRKRTWAVLLRPGQSPSQLPGEATLVEDPPMHWHGRSFLPAGHRYYTVAVSEFFDFEEYALQSRVSTYAWDVTHEMAPLSDQEVKSIYDARKSREYKMRQALEGLEPGLTDLIDRRIALALSLREA